MRNARAAGVTMLVYYAAAMGGIFFFRGATSPAVILSLVTVVCALVLAVTFYALTREVDREIALLAFTCRVVEGVCNAGSTAAKLGAMQLPSAGLLQATGWLGTVSGTIFAVGSTLFAYLFLRGRSIPVPLARLGIAGSLIVVPIFLLRAFGFVSGRAVWLTSMPLIAFELILALWLLIRGVER